MTREASPVFVDVTRFYQCQGQTWDRSYQFNSFNRGNWLPFDVKWLSRPSVQSGVPPWIKSGGSYAGSQAFVLTGTTSSFITTRVLGIFR
jgi:hypothetical protein